MTGGIHVRLVTTHEDAEAELEATAGLSGYATSSPVRIDFLPQGVPSDASLFDSLPPDELAEARFVDPVTLIITATVATLAVRLVNHWMKSRESGVQIDSRTQPVTISRLAGVPYGTVAIIQADGSTTLHKQDYDKPEDLIGKLTKLLETAKGG